MAGKRQIPPEQKTIKVYTYTRVSTAMQIDGYSLEAQRARLKAYADFNGFEIVGEYEDAGKSGKSIEGRTEFNRMMEDIKSGKDGISYVLVFKLSRFGRNAADVLSTLQIMQDFDVNLICVEDGIDSSKDAGKLMISVLSAVAEIERENIRIQTMEGRIQKAREGRWNGGFAPYGYALRDGVLVINEEEAEAIRIIFDQYVNTDMGANGVARYLANHGIGKIQRQNGNAPLFNAALIRQILKNPVYCGKIAYGRRKTEKVHGTRNEYQIVWSDDYLLVDGLHEGIVSEELWQAAQVKMAAQAKKYEKVNPTPSTHVHLLTTLIKCPLCGAGMYGNKATTRRKDGTPYMDRRVGKRTLIRIKDDVEKLPEWVKQFYRLRCEAENINFQHNQTTDETVVKLSKGEISSKPVRVEFPLEGLDTSCLLNDATYQQIKDYVFDHTGLHVSNLYIAQVKAKHGIIERECYNKAKAEGGRVPKCPPEKEKAIEEALRHFQMIP